MVAKEKKLAAEKIAISKREAAIKAKKIALAKAEAIR